MILIMVARQGKKVILPITGNKPHQNWPSEVLPSCLLPLQASNLSVDAIIAGSVVCICFSLNLTPLARKKCTVAAF